MSAFAAVHKTASAYEWRVVGYTCHDIDTSFLMELSEFRGRILYADGRRPWFLQSDGRYADDDALDSQSFHITVRKGGDLVGYIRIRLLPERSQSSLGRVVTERQFEAILTEMRVARSDCLEVSRWIVAPSERGTLVAPTLVVSAWAVGRWLGKRCLLAAVGKRGGQVTMLARFGGQIPGGVDANFIAEYDDELVMMHFDLPCPPARVVAKLSAVQRLLRLADRPGEQSELDRSCYGRGRPSPALSGL